MESSSGSTHLGRPAHHRWPELGHPRAVRPNVVAEVFGTGTAADVMYVLVGSRRSCSCRACSKACRWTRVIPASGRGRSLRASRRPRRPGSARGGVRGAERGSGTASGRPAGVAADDRFGEVELGQRAQETVRDDDVDARLRRRIERACERTRQRGIEVRHLDLDVGARRLAVDRRAALDLDLQVAVAVASGARDERAAGDPPGATPRVASIAYSGAWKRSSTKGRVSSTTARSSSS